MKAIRVAGVPEPYNLPWHLAMEQGAFTAAGIELQWHTVPEGSGRMCQMLRDDELDMAVLVTEAAVRDILNGGPHRIVSTFVESPLPWGVHVPARSKLFNAGDLKGVPFAISRRGSGSHLMAILYAQQLGWTPTEGDLVVVNNMEGAAQRMSAGEALVFLWEKFVTSRYVDAGVMRRVDVIQGGWPGFVVVAREGLISYGAGAIQKILALVRERARGLGPDRSSVERVMRNAGFNEATAHEWMQHVQWRLERATDEAFHPLLSVLGSSGLISPSSYRPLTT